MQRPHLLLAVATPLALFIARPDQLAKHIQHERERLVAHFDSVDTELRSRDASYLSPEQLAKRSRVIAWLRDYRAAGSFPLNDGVASEEVPIFRDSRGALCAVAYLIERSGRGDIVEGIAETRNTARIHDLVDDTRLVAWLDSAGLTVDEAARIQPTYQPTGSRSVTEEYALASVAFSGMALASSVVNVIAPSRTSGVLGVMTGTMALLTGIYHMAGTAGESRLATANAAIGVISIGASIRGFTVRKPEPARPVTGSRASFDNLRLAPTVTETLGRPQLGVAMSARF